MKAKEIEAIEKYYQTGNEHTDRYNFKLLKEITAKGLFKDPAVALRLFNLSDETLSDYADSPLKGLNWLEDQIKKEGLTPEQKLYFYTFLTDYLRHTAYGKEDDPIDLSDLMEILKSHRDKLEIELKGNVLTLKNVADHIRLTILKQIERLPKDLEDMDPYQRATIISKYLPYVMPKASKSSPDYYPDSLSI